MSPQEEPLHAFYARLGKEEREQSAFYGGRVLGIIDAIQVLAVEPQVYTEHLEQLAADYSRIALGCARIALNWEQGAEEALRISRGAHVRYEGLSEVTGEPV